MDNRHSASRIRRRAMAVIATAVVAAALSVGSSSSVRATAAQTTSQVSGPLFGVQFAADVPATAAIAQVRHDQRTIHDDHVNVSRVGAIGISGDGIDQDDAVAYM
jgi:hypothetical protein